MPSSGREHGGARTAGIATLSSKDAQHDPRGVAPCRRGMTPPEGIGGKGLSGT